MLVIVLTAILSLGAARSSPISSKAIELRREWECRRAISKLMRGRVRFYPDWRTTARGSTTVMRGSFKAERQGDRMTGICELETQALGERMVAVSTFLSDRF
jgi:hypothetical protein